LASLLTLPCRLKYIYIESYGLFRQYFFSIVSVVNTVTLEVGKSQSETLQHNARLTSVSRNNEQHGSAVQLADTPSPQRPCLTFTPLPVIYTTYFEIVIFS